MYSRIKISHRRYSGHYLPHEHTSYFGLAFLIVICALVLASLTFKVAAYNYGDPNPGPDAGSLGLSGTVKGPPPTEGAVITRPGNGTHFAATPVTVSGTCPKGTLVELFKNDIFAGATMCQDDKTFKLDIDLLFGANNLVARVYDVLDQPGPASNTVTVYYDALPQQGASYDSTNLNNIQLLLRAGPVFRGIFPDQILHLPIGIIGGRPPFALTIDWGDNKTDLISRPNNVDFDGTHAYARPGTYQVDIKATDADGRMAFVTVIVIVNGRAAVLSNSLPTSISTTRNALTLAWPLLVLAAAMVASYWYGEHREKHKLAMTLAY